MFADLDRLAKKEINLEEIAWVISLAAGVGAMLLLVRFVSGGQYDEHLQRGRDWLEEGETEKALEEFRRCVVIDPKKPEGFYYRGEAYFLAGERQDALDDFEQAMTLSTDEELAEKAGKKADMVRRGMKFMEITQGRDTNKI